MVKILTLLFIFIALSGCIDPDAKFTGYIVAKEYTPEHMSNEPVKTVRFSSLVHVPHIPINHRNNRHKVSEEWVWYIANKREVLKRQVTQELFHTKKCGDKVTIKKYSSHNCK